MRVVKNPHDMQTICRSLEGTLGFVPTMGALHQGHGELVRKARTENDHVAVSIFVNPTQFNDPKDLDKYPRTWEQDTALLTELGVDLLFFPDYESLYPDHYNYFISEKELSPRFCGADRPGHFNGVLTVVMKLLQIVTPTKAYFGQKDYQQLKLVEGLTKAFFIPTEIVAVPIVREESGLAMSSRNQRLSPEHRTQAARFSEILRASASADAAATALTEQGFKVDYVEDYENRRLGAIQVGPVRLIDNVEV